LLRNSLAGLTLGELLYNYHTLLIFLPSVNKMRFASFVILSIVTSAVHAIPVPLNDGPVAILEVRAGECKHLASVAQCVILTSLQTMETIPGHVSMQ
jgi:hypothetical protein